MSTPKSELLTLARDVAKQLPGKWRAAGCLGECVWNVTLRGEGSAELEIRTTKKKEQLAICGTYPGRYHDEKPFITVARNLGAHVIAREITRRVLPKYRPLLADALEIEAQKEAARKQQIDAAQRICDVLDRPKPFTQREAHSNNIHLTADYDFDGALDVESGGWVKVTLPHLSAEQTLQILEALRKIKTPKRENREEQQ